MRLAVFCGHFLICDYQVKINYFVEVGSRDSDKSLMLDLFSCRSRTEPTLYATVHPDSRRIPLEECSAVPLLSDVANGHEGHCGSKRDEAQTSTFKQTFSQ